MDGVLRAPARMVDNGPRSCHEAYGSVPVDCLRRRLWGQSHARVRLKARWRPCGAATARVTLRQAQPVVGMYMTPVNTARSSARGGINGSTSGSAPAVKQNGPCRARCYGRARIDRSAGNYLVSSATRRSTSSSTVPVLGRFRLPASSANSVLLRLW
jgi:hypothetical protein